MSDLVQLGNREITTKSLDNLIKLADSIDKVENKNDGEIYIKFKSDVIIESGKNFAVLTNGFNVQIADQIHFNPECNKGDFKALIREDFERAKIKAIEIAAEQLSLELTKEEILEIIDGDTSKLKLNDDHKCDHHH